MADEIRIDPRLRSVLDPTADPTSPLHQASQIARQNTAEARAAQGPAFGETLTDAIAEVNELRLEADKAIEDLAIGQTDDIQSTIMAMEKADLSFKLMMEMRNKILSAYQEVMRTQV